jgi:Leucine-rich repeat (LRR) protein
MVNEQGKTEMRPDWQRQVEILDLGHLRVETIKMLDRFVNLRKLVLLNNKIANIAGLENLHSLQELNLEKNKITQIQNLEHMAKSLKKLDLGSNQIKRI